MNTNFQGSSKVIVSQDDIFQELHLIMLEFTGVDYLPPELGMKLDFIFPPQSIILPHHICQPHSFLEVLAYKGKFEGFLYLCEKLGKKIASPNEKKNYSLFSYAYNSPYKNPQIIRHLLDPEQRFPAEFFHYSFPYIIRNGEVDLAGAFFGLMKGYKENSGLTDRDLLMDVLCPSQASPLKLAIKSDNVQMFEYILGITQEECVQLRDGTSIFQEIFRNGSIDILQHTFSTMFKQPHEVRAELMKKTKQLNSALLLCISNVTAKPTCLECLSFLSQYVADRAGDFPDFLSLFDSSNSDGNTPLHMAVRDSLIDVVSWILDLGYVNVNLKNKNGLTPLLLAIQNTDFQVFGILCDSPYVDLQAGDNLQRTPLIWSAKEGVLPIFERIASRDPGQLFVQDASGLTAVFWAAISGANNIVSYCIQKAEEMGPRSDFGRALREKSRYTGWNILHFAAQENQIETLEILLKSGFFDDLINTPSDDNKGTPLYYAISNQSVEAVKILLSHGANVKSIPQKLQKNIWQNQIQEIKVLFE